MKKKILIIVLLFVAFTVTAYELQDKNPTYPQCGTPIDKNCNGIPDYME